MNPAGATVAHPAAATAGGSSRRDAARANADAPAFALGDVASVPGAAASPAAAPRSGPDGAARRTPQDGSAAGESPADGVATDVDAGERAGQDTLRQGVVPAIDAAVDSTREDAEDPASHATLADATLPDRMLALLSGGWQDLVTRTGADAQATGTAGRVPLPVSATGARPVATTPAPAPLTGVADAMTAASAIPTSPAHGSAVPTRGATAPQDAVPAVVLPGVGTGDGTTAMPGVAVRATSDGAGAGLPGPFGMGDPAGMGSRSVHAVDPRIPHPDGVRLPGAQAAADGASAPAGSAIGAGLAPRLHAPSAIPAVPASLPAAFPTPVAEASTAADLATATVPEGMAPPGETGFIAPAMATREPTPTRAVEFATPVAMPADPEAGFDEAFGGRIVWMAEQRIGHAEMRVSPGALGPIDIRLEMDGQRVSAQFTATSPEVRQALEAGMDRLRDLLGRHGLELAQSSVGSESRQSQREASRGGAAAAGADVVEAPIPATGAQRARGLVDVYA